MYLYFGYPQVPDIQNNGNLWNLNIDEDKLLSLLSWTVLGDYGKVITKVVGKPSGKIQNIFDGRIRTNGGQRADYGWIPHLFREFAVFGSRQS